MLKSILFRIRHHIAMWRMCRRFGITGKPPF